MSHFLNARSTLVADAIDGDIRASGGRLARLDGYPDIRVVLRSDWDKGKVALVSGGGAGHEPAHVGFVGQGMLTAAVCGDVFASPSTDAVLAAILAVTGPAGALLIVKNYTGDRLNFGLAAERARAMGLAVEMVIVGDDVALPHLAQPRGIAGTLFVHKIAGHVAEQGGDLAAVKAAAATAAAATASIGMALTTCTVPGRAAEARIPSGEAELGLGIHGEPGADRMPLGPARDMVATLLARLAPAIAASEQPLALLINNLGGLPPIELAVVTDAILDSPVGQRTELVFGPAPMMTSLDMKGFSLSVLPLDGPRRAALLAPVGARAWSQGTVPHRPELRALPAGITAEARTVAAADRGATESVRLRVSTALQTLIGLEHALNNLDAKVGDGDTGTTVAGAAGSIEADLDSLLVSDWGHTLSAMARKTGQTMGGSSGVLISILLAATGTALTRGEAWPAALRSGLDRMSFYGGAQGRRPHHDRRARPCHRSARNRAADSARWRRRPARARSAPRPSPEPARDDRAICGPPICSAPRTPARRPSPPCSRRLPRTQADHKEGLGPTRACIAAALAAIRASRRPRCRSVAQSARAPVSKTGGWGFESLLSCHRR